MARHFVWGSHYVYWAHDGYSEKMFQRYVDSEYGFYVELSLESACLVPRPRLDPHSHPHPPHPPLPHPPLPHFAQERVCLKLLVAFAVSILCVRALRHHLLLVLEYDIPHSLKAHLSRN